MDKDWLLIFDNAEDAHDLAPFWPVNLFKGGAVIITAQLSGFSPMADNFMKHNIQPWRDEEGGECLFKYLQRPLLNDQDIATAKKISNVIGGSPLALETVGGYLGPSK